MRAAIVILNWNGIKFLQKYLPAVIAELPPDCTLVVADNGSTDGSLEWIAAEYPSQCRVIAFDKNYGFTGGYNRALKQVEADYYVIMNSDIRVPQQGGEAGEGATEGNWLEVLLEAFLSLVFW